MTTDVHILSIVTELLKKKRGDIPVLERIKRAAMQDEVISINERRYIEFLEKKFLQAEMKEKTVFEDRFKPVKIPKENPIPRKIDESVATNDIKRHAGKIPIKKIIIAVVAIIMISGVGILYINTDFDILVYTSSDKEVIDKLSIETDANEYSTGDIISVSGHSQEKVKISVLDLTNNVIWFEEIMPNTSGIYSVLIIADGDGWEDGTYTVMSSSSVGSESKRIYVR